VARARAPLAFAVAISTVAAVLSSSIAGIAPKIAWAGNWAGGYQIGSTTVVLRVTLAGRGTQMRGWTSTPAPPHDKVRSVSVPVLQASSQGARISLMLADGTQLVGFAHDGRITGSASGAGGRGRFELVLLRASRVRALARAVGVYRFPDGHAAALFLEPFGRALRLIDYGSGEIHQLPQIGRDDFVGGPRLLDYWPFSLHVQLIRDPAGNVVALRRNGQRAVRIPLSVAPVAFDNGEVHLVGKLVQPKGPGPFPAVLFVPGSVAANRDTYDMWGLFFASQGFAVLSYDKRGVGQSTGLSTKDPTEANLRALASDAVAGITWLGTQTNIDPRRIGLAGGSQAGWIIPLAASMSNVVAFAAIQSGPVMSAQRQRVYSTLTINGTKLPPPTDAEIRAALAGIRDGGFDPRPAIGALRIPVLWQLGALDKRGYTPESVANLEALIAAGANNITVRVYPGGAHSLRETTQGLAWEERDAVRVVPGVFADLAAWLRKTVA
jgi:dienelactone hydrolase